MIWKQIASFFDSGFQFIYVLTFKRGKASKHLIKKTTNRPDVNFLVLFLPIPQFWCHVQRCPTNRVTQLIIFIFCKSKITYYKLGIVHNLHVLHHIIFLILTHRDKIGRTHLLKMDHHVIGF